MPSLTSQNATSYSGSYSSLNGSQRAAVVCQVHLAGGENREITLASGARALLDWDTTADRASVAMAVLGHWLGRTPEPDDLHLFLDEIAIEWAAGQPWRLTDATLRRVGLKP